MRQPPVKWLKHIKRLIEWVTAKQDNEQLICSIQFSFDGFSLVPTGGVSNVGGIVSGTESQELNDLSGK